MAASVDSGTIVAEALGLAAFAMPGSFGSAHRANEFIIIGVYKTTGGTQLMWFKKGEDPPLPVPTIETTGLGGGLLAQAKRNSKNPRQKHVCHLK